MSRVTFASALAIVLAVATIRAARAEGPTLASESAATAKYPPVHLEVVPRDSELVPLLRAELDDLGLTVVGGPGSGASITLHATLGADSLEVRISDNANGAVVLREVFSIGNGRRMDARTAVLHASELLRWHLRYQPPSPPLADAPKPATPSPTAKRAKPSRDLRMGLLPLAIYSPGGTQLGLGGQLDFSYRSSWLAARAVGAGSLVPNRMAVAEGELRAISGWIGVEVAARWALGSFGTELELGGGAAFFTSASRGTATGSNQGRDDQLLTIAPLVDLRARQRITRGFTLLIASQALMPLESSRWYVRGRDVGGFGKQILTLGLGLELTLL
jgi:hypothetical protein